MQNHHGICMMYDDFVYILFSMSKVLIVREYKVASLKCI